MGRAPVVHELHQEGTHESLVVAPLEHPEMQAAAHADRLSGRALTASGEAPVSTGNAVPATFPTQDPDVVREVVRVAHFDLKRLKEFVDARPTLARAAWDW